MARNYNRINQRGGNTTGTGLTAAQTALLAGLMGGTPGTVLTGQAAAPGYGWQTPAITGSATELVAGLIEIATQAETDAGTDDARAVTPLKLKAVIDALNAAAIETAAIPGLAAGAASDVQTVVFFPNASTDNGQTRPAGIYVYDGTGWPLTPALALPTLNIGAATDAAQGLVELATPAEVQAGVDSTRAITAAGLASLIATDSLRGLVELATTAEGLAGTSTTLVPPVAVVQAMIDAAGANGIEETLFRTQAQIGSVLLPPVRLRLPLQMVMTITQYTMKGHTLM